MLPRAPTARCCQTRSRSCCQAALARMSLTEAGRFLAAIAWTAAGRFLAGRFLAGRFLAAMRWAVIARSSALSSLHVFGTHLPAEVFLSLMMPGVRVARLRSCGIFMSCKISVSNPGAELAEPGTSADSDALSPRRTAMALEAASIPDDRVTWSMAAATTLRSVSASSLRDRTGPSNVSILPCRLNWKRALQPLRWINLRMHPTWTEELLPAAGN
jgi:hypothetical protein